jgi:hypothetical protein
MQVLSKCNKVLNPFSTSTSRDLSTSTNTPDSNGLPSVLEFLDLHLTENLKAAIKALKGLSGIVLKI